MARPTRARPARPPTTLPPTTAPTGVFFSSSSWVLPLPLALFPPLLKSPPPPASPVALAGLEPVRVVVGDLVALALALTLTATPWPWPGEVVEAAGLESVGVVVGDLGALALALALSATPGEVDAGPGEVVSARLGVDGPTTTATHIPSAPHAIGESHHLPLLQQVLVSGMQTAAPHSRFPAGQPEPAEPPSQTLPRGQQPWATQ